MRTKNEIMKEAQELKDQHEKIKDEAESLGAIVRNPNATDEQGRAVIERMLELSEKSIKLVAKMKAISREAYELKKALSEYDFIG